ncbi:hypothetical protein V499_05361 [Pseudogymnoascus sp. VKM F-103]|nr:hypothetical protein V499_05361 [Pseudogymnoascus sp. VKM F-103]
MPPELPYAMNSQHVYLYRSHYCGGGLGNPFSNCVAPSTQFTQLGLLEVNDSTLGVSFSNASPSKTPILTTTISVRIGVSVHIVEPQLLQKLTYAGFPLPPLASNTFASPETIVNADFWNIAFVEYADPVDFRQLLQWQRPCEPCKVEIAKRSSLKATQLSHPTSNYTQVVTIKSSNMKLLFPTAFVFLGFTIALAVLEPEAASNLIKKATCRPGGAYCVANSLRCSNACIGATRPTGGYCS